MQESPHWQPTKCVQYHHTQKGMIINLIYLEQWLYPGGKDIRGIYGSIISIIHGITSCTHKHTFARTTFRVHSLAMLARAIISTFARVGSSAATYVKGGCGVVVGMSQADIWDHKSYTYGQVSGLQGQPIVKCQVYRKKGRWEKLMAMITHASFL